MLAKSCKSLAKARDMSDFLQVSCKFSTESCNDVLHDACKMNKIKIQSKILYKTCKVTCAILVQLFLQGTVPYSEG